ncbi:MAG: DUF2946 family protein [Burkholderiales bacterium]
MRRSRSSFPALLAIFAMALHGIWPLLAQAMPRAPALSVAVCTAGGVVYHLDLPAGESRSERGAASFLGHCAFCTSGAGAPAIPQAAALALALAEPEGARRLSYAGSDCPASLSCPPRQPRAPPPGT